MDKMLSYYLHYLGRYLDKQIENYDKENGISTIDSMIVDYVNERCLEGYETIQKDIENEFYIGKAVCSDLLSSLENRGYINREIDKHDGRKKVLTLTSKGHELHKQNIEKIKIFDDLMVSNLKRKDKDTLLNLLEELTVKIKEDGYGENN